MNFDFSGMLNKMKETFKQSLNITEINKAVKTLSETFESLLSNNKTSLKNEIDFGKYNTSYQSTPNKNPENNILYLALVSFHQKKGSVVELTYPKTEEILSNPSPELQSLIDENDQNSNSISSLIEKINSQLVNYALMDGIHLVDNGTLFFFLHNLKKPIYCLSYYVQVKTGPGNPVKIDDFQENVRECIQKSLCIVSTVPIFSNLIMYQNLYTYLSTQMSAFMEQESLNDKSKLDGLYKTILSMKIDYDSTFHNNKCIKWLFNLRKLFCLLKEDIITVMKLILLEKNIIVFSSNPTNVSIFIMSLLSIFPGEISQGFSNFDNQSGTPFRFFHQNYLIYPLFTLFDLTPLLEVIQQKNDVHYFIGTSNYLVASTKNINYDCCINIDELKVTYSENLDENLKTLNKDENKVIEIINKEININISSFYSKNYNLNKKFNIQEEEWIISSENEILQNEFRFIKKNLAEYFMNIAFDISYILLKMQPYINSKEEICKIEKEYSMIYNILKENYEKFNNSENSIQGISKSLPLIENNNNKLILPRIDEIASDSIIYLINNILNLSNNNQINMGITPTPESLNKLYEKKIYNLNTLIFIINWSQTKNFKYWLCTYTDKITLLSQLNIKKTTAEKIYDIENNEYSGGMLLGKKHGKGRNVYVHDGTIYVGEYKNDQKHGKGNLFSSDNLYLSDGDWKNDKLDGEASFVSPDIGKYVGGFSKGVFEGSGFLIDNEKNVYQGTFHDGKKNGKGELSMLDGKKYIGEFKNNLYNGMGKIIDASGKVIQEGRFNNGIFVGLNDSSKEIKKENEKENKKEDEKEDKKEDKKENVNEEGKNEEKDETKK